MSTDRNRVAVARLSRYEWGVFALLAAAVVTGVTMEISRLSARGRTQDRNLPTVSAVSSSSESQPAPSVNKLSAN